MIETPKDVLDAETWVFYASALEAENARILAELQRVQDDREKWMRKAIDQASQVLALRAALEGTDQ